MPKKPKKTKDPHFKREAEKYERPIPSREYILSLLQEAGKPLSYMHIADALDLRDDESLDALDRRLHAMVRDGQLIKNRRDTYCLVDKMQLIPGRVIGHKDGFGFLVPDNGSKDLFLSPREMRAVWHGDRALVSEGGLDRRGRREGHVVEVLERNTPSIVGRYYEESGTTFVKPEQSNFANDIFIRDSELKPKNGQLVVVEITEWPTGKRLAIGRVSEILGDHMAPGMEIDVAIRSHNLPYEWSEEVIQEVKGWTEEVPKAAYANRKDLRDLPFVTIDGEDARDFDDAVVTQKTDKGFRLLVAIADVSYYVKPGTALDEEAYNRATSVYFPERVIPMLPEILSNGLCSLKPNVDRLSMVCEMFISNAGIIKHTEIYEAVICSKARLTYTQVSKFLKEEDLNAVPEALHEDIKRLHDLYERLLAQRQKRGAIEFDTTETRIIFDDQRKIEKIVPLVRNDAHKLIEECMLAANESVALFLEDNKIPILYRIHDQPKEEKIAELRDFLAPFGLTMGGGDTPKPMDYTKLIERINTRDDKHMLQMVLLRSMNQAIYSPDNIGHFGLAYPVYTHFTSPIRRYPDLLVHRALKALINKDIDGTVFNEGKMLTFGDHCSMAERRADDATRDVTDWLKCEYMQDHVGSSFEGIITGVTNFGLFVELKDIYVEGLVHISNLEGDYYRFDATHHILSGENTGQIFRISDKVQVKVASVNLDDRKIDFQLEKQLTAQQRTLRSNAPAKPKSQAKPWGKPSEKGKGKPRGKSKGKPKGKSRSRRKDKR